MTTAFTEYKIGDKVNLAGKIFDLDRENGFTTAKVAVVDVGANRLAIEFTHRGWLAADNSFGKTYSALDKNKKYFWVFDPQHIEKVEEPGNEGAVKAEPTKAEAKVVEQAKVVETTKVVAPPVTVVVKAATPAQEAYIKENAPSPTISNQETKEKHMTLSVLDQAKLDAVSAGYRAGSRKLTENAQKALTALMKGTGSSRSEINAAIKFANSRIGKAFVSQGLGQILTRFPGLKDNAKVQRLAEELRVEGLAEGMEMTVDAFMNKLVPNVMPDMMQLINSLPEVEVKETKAEKVRVVHKAHAQDVSAEEEHEAEEELASFAKGKTARA